MAARTAVTVAVMVAAADYAAQTIVPVTVAVGLAVTVACEVAVVEYEEQTVVLVIDALYLY